MRSFAYVLFPAACSLLASTGGAVAHAQEQPSADLRGTFAPLHHEAGLAIEPADSPESGELTGNVRFSYAFRPVVLRDASEEIAYRVVEHQFTGDLGLAVGILGRLTVGVDIPVLMGQTGDDLTGAEDAQRVIGSSPIPVTAIGDPGVRLKLTFVKPEQVEGNPRGPALGLDERFTVPLGDERSFIAEGHVASETRVLFDYFAGVVSAHAAAGVKLRADDGSFACDPDQPESACGSRFGHELPFVAGLALHPYALGIDPEARGTLFVETRGRVPVSPVTPDVSTQALSWYASVAGRYRLGDVALLAGVELGLWDGVGNAPFRATFGVSFAPRASDADRDGFSDDDDKCPQLAEDRDGFEDDDGCPEMDNDRDGVPDSLDECPTAPGKEGAGC